MASSLASQPLYWGHDKYEEVERKHETCSVFLETAAKHCADICFVNKEFTRFSQQGPALSLWLLATRSELTLCIRWITLHSCKTTETRHLNRSKNITQWLASQPTGKARHRERENLKTEQASCWFTTKLQYGKYFIYI